MSKTTHWLILNLSDLSKLAKNAKKVKKWGLFTGRHYQATTSGTDLRPPTPLRNRGLIDFGIFRETSVKIGKDRTLKKVSDAFGKTPVYFVSGRHNDDH